MKLWQLLLVVCWVNCANKLGSPEGQVADSGQRCQIQFALEINGLLLLRLQRHVHMHGARLTILMPSSAQHCKLA